MPRSCQRPNGAEFTHVVAVPATFRNDVLYIARFNTAQIFALRKRNAFTITDTELKLMAAAAIIGLSSRPKNG